MSNIKEGLDEVQQAIALAIERSGAAAMLRPRSKVTPSAFAAPAKALGFSLTSQDLYRWLEPSASPDWNTQKLGELAELCRYWGVYSLGGRRMTRDYFVRLVLKQIKGEEIK